MTGKRSLKRRVLRKCFKTFDDDEQSTVSQRQASERKFQCFLLVSEFPQKSSTVNFYYGNIFTREGNNSVRYIQKWLKDDKTVSKLKLREFKNPK